MLRAYRALVGMLLVFGLPVLSPGQASAQQTNPEVQFYVLGDKYPKGLSDFQAFGLFRKETGRGKPAFSGWVMSDRDDPNGSAFDMGTIRLRGKRLAFTTVSHKGLVFTFDGQFLRSGDFRPYFNRQVPVVEGMVRKFRKGRKVAEARMRFSCGSGG